MSTAADSTSFSLDKAASGGKAERDDYRPDIDGLRAIAVAVVVIFHVCPQYLTGGFVGVDIFFVISGYLITGLVLRESAAHRFSLMGFYERRAKRLLPALAVVSFSTMAFTLWLFTPADLLAFMKSCLAAWGFVANVFFAGQSDGYFVVPAERQPFLHTWSLSVEEQFYLIYPLLLVALRRTRLLPLILAAAAAIFVFVSELRLERTNSFFLLDARAHELLFGAIGYLVVTRGVPIGTFVANLLGIAGLTLISMALFRLSPETSFPGFNSLSPVAGTTLLLIAGSVDGALRRILANRGLVFIGLLSYSIYLWHWPILSLLRYRGIEITLLTGLLAVGATIVCAYLTYRYVENPVRRSAFRSSRGLLFVYMAPAGCVALLAWIVVATDGFPQRFSPSLQRLMESYATSPLDWPCELRLAADPTSAERELSEHCRFGSPDVAPQLLLIGDSHAHHFKPFLEVLMRDSNLAAVYSTTDGCDPLIGIEPIDWSACAARNRLLYSLGERYRYVAIAGRWQYLEREEVLRSRLMTLVDRLRAAGVTAVLFKDSPSYKADLSRCALRQARGWARDESNCSFDREWVDRMQSSTDAVIDAVAASFPGTIVIDPKLVMCSTNRCSTHEDNLAFYRDGDHLNAAATRFLAERYLERTGLRL